METILSRRKEVCGAKPNFFSIVVLGMDKEATPGLTESRL